MFGSIVAALGGGKNKLDASRYAFLTRVSTSCINLRIQLTAIRVHDVLETLNHDLVNILGQTHFAPVRDSLETNAKIHEWSWPMGFHWECRATGSSGGRDFFYIVRRGKQ